MRLASDVYQEMIGLKTSIIEAASKAGEGHIASALSILDIIYVLYGKILQDDKQDKFVLSKGHGSLALYAVLASHDFFRPSELQQFGSYAGCLGGHPDRNKVQGIEASTGSLGHGLPFGLGMALALRIKKASGRVFVLVGDGECNEGSIWEAILLAAHHNLSNLTCIVESNHSTDRALLLGDLQKKFEAFGWSSVAINGHDHTEISSAIFTTPQRPLAIIAETVKGHGCRQMENDPAWHHRVPTQEELPGLLEQLY